MGGCTSEGIRSVRMGMGKTTVSAGNAESGCAWTESTLARDLLPLLNLGWEVLLGWELPLALLWRDPCLPPFLLSTHDCLVYGRRLGHDCVHGWKNDHDLRVARVLCVRSDRGHLSPAPAACVGLVRDGRPQTRCFGSISFL